MIESRIRAFFNRILYFQKSWHTCRSDRVGGAEPQPHGLCMGDCVSSLTRPIRELKGFKKVFIEKGKKSTITFKIGYEELGYFRNDGKYAVETGTFRIYIGKDCVDSNFIEVEVI